MKNTAYITLLLMLLSATIGGCTVITGDYSTSIADSETNPLLLMLHTVPSNGVTRLMYNDITVLSYYQGKKTPPRDAPLKDRREWWESFQEYILYSYPTPFFTEVWGFDAVDVYGILTSWGEQPLTILCGDLDTAAFRKKLLSYQYEEVTYLGVPVFFGRHVPTGEFIVDILPWAFGIIEGVKVGNDTMSFILMSGSGDDDTIERAKMGIEAAIAAYQLRLSLADDSSNHLTRLARTLGRVGSAYITTYTRYNNIVTRNDEGQNKPNRATIKPDGLGPYDALGMAFRREEGNIKFDFILAYSTPADAEAALLTFRMRLSRGYSTLHDSPLLQLWTIESDKISDTLLMATVRLFETTSVPGLFFTTLVYSVNHWLLHLN